MLFLNVRRVAKVSEQLMLKLKNVCLKTINKFVNYMHRINVGLKHACGLLLRHKTKRIVNHYEIVCNVLAATTSVF